MEERQQQLVAAAEAMRQWVHAQRAIWAQGYPQSLVHAQPQLMSGGVAAMPSLAAVATATATVPTVFGDFSPEPETVWPDANASQPSPPAVSERVSEFVQQTTGFVRAQWRMFAAVLAVAVIVAVVRLAWPGLHQAVSSNLAARREAGKTQTPARTGSNRAAQTTATAAAGAGGSGQLQVESSPNGAHVVLDGKDRGVTPLTLDGLSVGPHKVVIRGDQGSVQRTISITAGERAQLSESIYSGWLHVSAPFEVRLSEGRKAITLDDSNQVLLAPGPHDLRFENRGLGVREVRHVDIKPGETTAITLETPTSHLTVTSSEPATVSVDGHQVGETPLSQFAVPIGTRDVTVTSASGDVRHQTLTVTVQPAQIDVDFSKH